MSEQPHTFSGTACRLSVRSTFPLQQTGRSAQHAWTAVKWQAKPKEGSTHLREWWSVCTSICESVQRWSHEWNVWGHAVAMLRVVEPWQCRRQLCLHSTARVSDPRQSHAGQAFFGCCNSAHSPERKPAVAGRNGSPAAAAMQGATKVYKSHPSTL